MRIADLTRTRMHAGARSLIGLEDKDVYPIRGQTIVIDNPKVNEFISTELGTVPSYLPVPTLQTTQLLSNADPC